MKVTFCGVKESAQSEECSLGFAQMILDLPFMIPGMENLALAFSDDTSSVIDTFMANEDTDVLVCMPTFKSNLKFVTDAVLNAEKKVILGVEPCGKIDWDRVASGGPAFAYDETFLTHAIRDSYDGKHVRVNRTITEVLSKARCFVLNKRATDSAVWIDVHNIMNCGLHVEFVGSVMPRILSLAA